MISPLLANIYLDLWFNKKIEPQVKGHMELMRYCDDFVVCCESEKRRKECSGVTVRKVRSV